MIKKIVAVIAALLILFGPAGSMLGMAVLLNPAAVASCLPGSDLALGAIPDLLTATTSDGQTVTLNKSQLTHAGTILTVGGQINGVGHNGVVIALIAALTESSLRMLTNPTYPESSNYPNDGVGSDHDSLGLFQMRPQAEWGTVAQLMDPTYQAKAFFGGPTGPNFPSPAGLLDISGWQQLPPGEAAQEVEVSEFPERYANYLPVAEKIVSDLTTPAPDNAGRPSPGGDAPSVPETSRVVFPLPEGTWVKSDNFGPRTDPITGEASFHAGTDLAAAGGTPILAAADGRVVFAGMTGDTGTIRILSTVSGEAVGTTYLHMWPDGILVTVGQMVTAGQQIGAVGSSGHSTGNHLHFEVHPGGTDAAPIDSMPWLAEHGAGNIGSPSGQSAGCGASIRG
jgi:murein DD-endopeptidase MepM/ murein hydrolase activator NlpD